ncbi:predicted protein [Streptomyces filamentosus NRRL 15998]|uniref:Predicted protein n=1 Tax=Streptomyces filamentosus NRRL 15998 TaxID=457431 RepID=D6AEM2_STRFL|nr:predicted protein [Streptomyces filamentosus NRRL 15998]
MADSRGGPSRGSLARFFSGRWDSAARRAATTAFDLFLSGRAEITMEEVCHVKHAAEWQGTAPGTTVQAG